jgi:hypothetical protein
MECSAARDQGEDRKHHAFEEGSFFFRSLEVVRNRPCPPTLPLEREIEEDVMGRGILLWLLGIPIPVIILLWLFFGR